MIDLGTKTLETERLIIRAFTIEDADGMFNNWASDPLTAAKLSWEPHKSVEDTKKLLEMWINNYNKPFYFNWIVELKSTHEVIGNICTINQYIFDEICQISNCYGSKYWGNGYASEAMRKVLEFLLNEVGFRLIEACNYSTNDKRGKLLEKVGMKFDGVLRKRRIDKASKTVCDVYYYSITKEEL